MLGTVYFANPAVRVMVLQAAQVDSVEEQKDHLQTPATLIQRQLTLASVSSPAEPWKCRDLRIYGGLMWIQ